MGMHPEVHPDVIGVSAHQLLDPAFPREYWHVVWDKMALSVLKEFSIVLTGREFSYQQDYVDENRWGMHNKTPQLGLHTVPSDG
jgi:hypothetical protein